MNNEHHPSPKKEYLIPHQLRLSLAAPAILGNLRIARLVTMPRPGVSLVFTWATLGGVDGIWNAVGSVVDRTD